jgi:hypothetical protein
VRRASLLVGLAATGVGAWLLARSHAEATGCVPVPVSQPGFGASPSCYTQVWVGYAGFALFVGGLLAIAAALLLIRRTRVAAAGAPRPRSLLGTPGELLARSAEAPDPAVVRPLRADDGDAAAARDRPPSAA